MSSGDRKGTIGTSAYWLKAWPQRYGLALIAVAVATLARYALSTFLGANVPFFLFYPTVWFVTWMAGLWPGICAVILSAVSAEYLLTGLASSSTVGLRVNTNGLILFSIAGIGLSGLADMYRRRGERLREFKRAVEGLDEMIAVVDRDYRYVIANHALLERRGVKSEDLIGRRVSEML